MTFTGKLKNEKDIEFYKYVLQLSGATERQFVAAAVLHYSAFLLDRAEELRQKEVDRILAAQKAEKQANESESSDLNGNNQVAQPVETSHHSTLAVSESPVVNS